MADVEILGVDLFGDPIFAREVKLGRRPHERTDEKAKRVSMLFSLGRTVEQVAAAMGVTQPTLRKHYFHEVEQRHGLLDRLEGKMLTRLWDQSSEGSTAATKALLDRCDNARLAKRAVVAAKGGEAKQQRSVRKGKKQEELAAAEDVGGLYARRTPPPEMVN